MIRAFVRQGGGLVPWDGPPGEAIWIDLFDPTPDEAASVAALGVEVPSLADMEEIEVSNRLYREDGAEVMTVVLPGHDAAGAQVTGPVTFILTPERMVTVRHHSPRPFETFPGRAGRSSTGCADTARLFLGLVEDIVARLADHLEAAGRSLDAVARSLYGSSTDAPSAEALAESLRATGRDGEQVARVRLSLMTIERMVAVWSLWEDARDDLRVHAKTVLRDVQALETHAEFLGSRVGLATDTTLGLVNLSQNQAVRIVSVVSVLFLPPTLIGTVYGMNFAHMPELTQPWGYPMALALMAGSAVLSYAYCRWRGWL